MEQHGNENSRFFSRIGISFLAGGLVVEVLYAVAGFLLSVLKPEWIENYNVNIMLSAGIVYFLALPVIICMLRRIPAEAPARVSMKWYHWFGALAVSMGVAYSSNIIGLIFTGVFAMFKGSAVQNEVIEMTTHVDPGISLVCAVLIAPVFEEFVFRKLLLDRVRKYGEGIAVVLSGLMFGLFHGNLNQFAYALTLGFVLAYIYLKTGKLIYTIMIHMTINSIGGFFLPMIMKSMDFEEYLRQTMIFSQTGKQDGMMSYLMENGTAFLLMMLIGLFMLTMILLGIILLLVNLKKIRFAKGEITIPKGERFRTVIVNVGMILYCIYWLFKICQQLLA